MAGSLLRDRLSSIRRTSAERMDDMNPQTNPMIASRVALERFDTVDHHRRPPAHNLSASLARLARLIAAPITHLIASRRSPARGAAPLPLRSGSDG